tara:strand:+ start:6684 stop:7079 length:396 start_codon:yes stop_codon:yes gene_type:complete
MSVFGYLTFETRRELPYGLCVSRANGCRHEIKSHPENGLYPIAIQPLNATIRNLMLGNPVYIDTDAVIQTPSNIEGVIDLHHVHFWQMGEHEASLETHVVIDESGWKQLEEIKQRMKQTLGEEFNNKSFEL